MSSPNCLWAEALSSPQPAASRISVLTRVRPPRRSPMSAFRLENCRGRWGRTVLCAGPACRRQTFTRTNAIQQEGEATGADMTTVQHGVLPNCREENASQDTKKPPGNTGRLK